jgi:hypothetical protein
MQECKVLNIVNHYYSSFSDLTSDMINEQLADGWRLFAVFLLDGLKNDRKIGWFRIKGHPSALTVILVREK